MVPALVTKPKVPQLLTGEALWPKTRSLPWAASEPLPLSAVTATLTLPSPGKVNLIQGSRILNDGCMIIRMCEVFHRPGLFSRGMPTNGSFCNTLGSPPKA